MKAPPENRKKKSKRTKRRKRNRQEIENKRLNITKHKTSHVEERMTEETGIVGRTQEEEGKECVAGRME